MTEPFTPADCDLRGMPFMPLDVVRLIDSDLFALSTGDEFKAAVALWCKSWLQLPAGSLPKDDRVLAHLSSTGSRWAKVKAMALRGWVECSDGRLYHAVVAAKARDAWEHRKAQRARVAKRWADKDPDTDPDAPIGQNAKHRSGVRSERMTEARRKGTHTAREWNALLEICGHKCVRCGASGRLEKDHILPIYAGGSDAIDNLQPLCPRCNCKKGPDQADLRPFDWEAHLPTVMSTAVGNWQASGDSECMQGTGTVKGEEKKEPPTLRVVPPSRKSRCDPDWWPDEAGQRKADDSGISDLNCEVVKFRDYHTAKGSLMADWAAAWRTWCGNAATFAKPKPRFRPGPAGALDVFGLTRNEEDQFPPRVM